MWSKEAKEAERPQEEKIVMSDMSLVSVRECRQNTDRIMAAIKDIGDKVDCVHGMLERHLGEHNGAAKADVRATNRTRRIGVLAAIIMGTLTITGGFTMGIIKIVGMI